MPRVVVCLVTVLFCLTVRSIAGPTETQPSIPKPKLLQPSLTAPGSTPFHLKAKITNESEPDDQTIVEIYWVAPDQWRRTIKSNEFSQTRIVNGSKVFEQNVGDYIPIYLQTLLTAMTDPGPLLDAVRPGDRLVTQANGSRPKPAFCANLQDQLAEQYAALCGTGIYADMEIVGLAARPVEFADYRAFRGRKVARLLTCTIKRDETYRAEVTTLDVLKKPDPQLFEFAESTPPENQIQTVDLPDAELRGLVPPDTEIIWPQVLDGTSRGMASFYVATDRTGKIREIILLHSDNERANETALRQLAKWKIRPATKDSLPVQAEGVLTLELNTRKFGPPEPLNNEEVRKLVSNAVAPNIPAGQFPSGTPYTLHAAIDDEGNLIEVIAGDGPHELFMPCYDAIRKWKFAPAMENGLARPYRAVIEFRTP